MRHGIGRSTRRGRTSERGALALGWLILVTATAGAAIGAGLGVGGVNLVRDVQVLGPDAVTFYDCPGGVDLGDFHRGDRVYATARIEGGAWIEVRSPHNPGVRVWIEMQYAVPDRSTDDLPVVDCGTEELAASTTTTSALGPDTTTTTGGGPASTSTTVSGPSDATDPTVGSVGASPNTIYEVPQSAPPPDCVSGAASSSVSAAVSDNVGIASVTITWTVGTRSGSATQSHGSGTYSQTIGSFPSDTLPVGTQSGITVTFTATDAAGNTASTTLNNASLLKLISCGTT